MRGEFLCAKLPVTKDQVLTHLIGVQGLPFLVHTVSQHELDEFPHVLVFFFVEEIAGNRSDHNFNVATNDLVDMGAHQLRLIQPQAKESTL